MPPRLRMLLPGLLVAATGVGAGDLVTASLAGAHAGPAVLWAVFLGATMKWVLNVELARWQLATGTTLLEGWVRCLGGAFRWLFLAYLVVWSVAVGSALASACGVAGHALLPLDADPARSKAIWGIGHSLAGLALVLGGGFSLFETAMAACTAVMFVTVLVTACGMAPPVPVLLAGSLVPSFPTGSLAWVVALLGGVGGTLTILSYGYWIREEGREGATGLADCRLDLGVAYAMTALFSASMVAIGSRMPALVGGKGAALAATLAAGLEPVLGAPARWAFLLGFWAAVFSSLLGVWQGVPYLFADFVALWRGEQADPPRLRASFAYRAYLVGLALAPAAFLMHPLQQVQMAYALLGAWFMPVLAATLLWMNSRSDLVGEEHRSGPATRLALAGVLVFFAWAGWAGMAGSG